MFEPQTIANAPAVMVLAAVDDGMFLGVPLIMVLMSLPAIFCAVLAASRVLDRCAAPCDSAQGAFGHGSARRRFGGCAPAPGTADAVRLLAALEAFGFPVAELSPDGIADRRRMLQTGVDPVPRRREIGRHSARGRAAQPVRVRGPWLFSCVFLRSSVARIVRAQ